jgi:hypothetical protein
MSYHTQSISKNGQSALWLTRRSGRNDEGYSPPGTIFADGLWRLSLGPAYELLIACLKDIRNDKGEAVGRITMWYNDFSMLKRVSYPVLIRSSNSYSGIEESIPGLMVTQEMGPKGWNSAVLRIIRENMQGGIARDV